jgi:hypothetical protein
LVELVRPEIALCVIQCDLMLGVAIEIPCSQNLATLRLSEWSASSSDPFISQNIRTSTHFANKYLNVIHNDLNLG